MNDKRAIMTAVEFLHHLQRMVKYETEVAQASDLVANRHGTSLATTQNWIRWLENGCCTRSLLTVT